MNTQLNQNNTQKPSANDEMIRSTAERLITQEVLACQSMLVDALQRQDIVEGFTIDDLHISCFEQTIGEIEMPEIYEWWLVTPWLAEKLIAISQPVLDNGYGQWWGRTCSGQAIEFDGTMQEIARLIHRDD